MLNVYDVQDEICKDADLVEKVEACMDECIKLSNSEDTRKCIDSYNFDVDVQQYIYKEVGFGA